MNCARPACFGEAKNGPLCAYCERIKESVLLVGLCLGGSALIVAAARFL